MKISTGTILVQTKYSTFEPITVEGISSYSTFQVFEDLHHEGLFGLGQHQSNEINYKGKNEQLFQYNTKVSIPIISSTKGYGILWHSYSISRFGDPREMGNLNDYFNISDKNGKEGILAIYSNSSGDFTRQEFNIDYEDILTYKNFPEGFPSQKQKW